MSDHWALLYQLLCFVILLRKPEYRLGSYQKSLLDKAVHPKREYSGSAINAL